MLLHVVPRTAALVHFFYSVTRMFENSTYVKDIIVDFTKAFDVIDHSVLMSKMAEMQLPGNLYSWIPVSFFSIYKKSHLSF